MRRFRNAPPIQLSRIEARAEGYTRDANGVGFVGRSRAIFCRPVYANLTVDDSQRFIAVEATREVSGMLFEAPGVGCVCEAPVVETPKWDG